METRLNNLEKRLDRLGEFTYKTSTGLTIVGIFAGAQCILFAIYVLTR